MMIINLVQGCPCLTLMMMMMMLTMMMKKRMTLSKVGHQHEEIQKLGPLLQEPEQWCWWNVNSHSHITCYLDLKTSQKYGRPSPATPDRYCRGTRRNLCSQGFCEVCVAPPHHHTCARLAQPWVLSPSFWRFCHRGSICNQLPSKSFTLNKAPGTGPSKQQPLSKSCKQLFPWSLRHQGRCKVFAEVRCVKVRYQSMKSLALGIGRERFQKKMGKPYKC